MRRLQNLWPVLLLAAGLQSASAFALLGPFAPWMTSQLLYRNGDLSIGGPMNIGEGYRWNVPVITYGFDPSFLDYFGTNGVAAVESAIQILKDLPPASSINLDDYPLFAARMNYYAASLDMDDLKSITLSLLLEQLGLASPTRFVYTLHDFTDPDNYTIIMRNFDPVTFEPSQYVNGTIYGYQLFNLDNFADAAEIAIDPFSPTYTAVADNAGFNNLRYGGFYIGLTRDDVGGLQYLLNSNNIALENLIPGVRGFGSNACNYVSMALRPGVDKITFQRLNYDSAGCKFLSVTNQFVDSYVTNGVLQHQLLERVITRPDILFTVKTTNYDNLYDRTGTSNWVNNGLPSHDGRGVIQPPVAITFNPLGPSLYHYGPTYTPATFLTDQDVFASFDGTTNPPIAYPITLAVTNSTAFHFWLITSYAIDGSSVYHHYSWNLPGQPNALFQLQTSTDLTNWSAITSITNLGRTFSYLDEVNAATPARYFRTIPQ